MFTIVVLFIIGACWLVSRGKYASTGAWRYRRMSAAFAWSFVFAIAGSFFGVAGFGSAIAGTVPSAVIGYVVASNLMKKDVDPNA